MPYVEGFGTWPFGEEWLWEAIATVYLPLAELLAEAGASVTLGLTPVLCDQLETLTGPAGQRLLGFLDETRAIVHAEDAAGLEDGGEPALAAEVRRAALDYSSAADALRENGADVLGELAGPAVGGPVELWTSAATHAVLPLVATDAGRRLQLATGFAAHKRRFGSFGGGLWLPECAYEPGLERQVAAHGARVICVDQTDAHGLGSLDALEPVLTDAGVVAVPIDWQSIGLVWGKGSGYPADATYRDYHRRTTRDLRPWANSGQAYDADAANALATEHARDFVEHCIERLDSYARERGRRGVLCCALDTELLGHWWYEGLTWLRAALATARERGLELATVSDAIERTDLVQRPLTASTWGRRRDMSTWDSPQVAELVFDVRRAELLTVARAGELQRGAPEAFERAARELLALQSSDWAFQITGELAGDYPRRRVRGHMNALADALRSTRAPAGASGDYASASMLEGALRNLAPDLDPASLLAP